MEGDCRVVDGNVQPVNVISVQLISVYMVCLKIFGLTK